MIAAETEIVLQGDFRYSAVDLVEWHLVFFCRLAFNRLITLGSFPDDDDTGESAILSLFNVCLKAFPKRWRFPQHSQCPVDIRTSRQL